MWVIEYIYKVLATYRGSDKEWDNISLYKRTLKQACTHKKLWNMHLDIPGSKNTCDYACKRSLKHAYLTLLEYKIVDS